MKSKSVFKSKAGQVLVEYLLLMVIGVGCATLLTKQLVNREPGKSGLIITAWNKILINVGKDLPDCAKPGCN